MTQSFLRILSQDDAEFLVNGLDRGGRNPEIEDTRLKVPDKDQTAEIAVTRDEDALLAASYKQQLAVHGFGAADLGCGNHIMAGSPQETDGHSIDILIEEKPHAGTRT
jgi:hypothetical protein